jgi:hypothetical protein
LRKKSDEQGPPMILDEAGRKARDGYIRGVIDRYQKKEEWEILKDVRAVVEAIDARLANSKT